MAKQDDKTAVLVRFDTDEIELLDIMCQQDIRDRTSFIRSFVRQEAARRGITKPTTDATAKKPPKGKQ